MPVAYGILGHMGCLQSRKMVVVVVVVVPDTPW